MKWLGIILAGVIGVIVLYKLAYPSVTLRYCLTLEAEVDGQPKSGSGVIEVTYSKQSEIASGRDHIVSYKGEAVILDLGARGALFALLRAGTDSRSSPESIVLRAFEFPGGAFPGPTVDAGLERLQRVSGKRELPLESLPLLVSFRNLNDPKTVERVDPHNLAARFGPGAKLVRVTLEITRAGIWPLNVVGVTGEPITTGIEKWLPWLVGMRTNIDGTSITNSNRLSNELNSGDFRRG